MKITFVLPTVNMSGGIRVVSIYAKALEEIGHKVILVSVPRRSLSVVNKIKSFLKGRGWPKNLTSSSHLDGLNLDHRVLEKNRPVVDSDVPDADVIIATWWETAEWVMKLSETKGAKTYFIQHHEVHPHLPVERCRDTYKQPMHKIVVAKWLVGVMNEEYGDTNVDLVPNSVDQGQFFADVRGKQTRPTIGFLYSRSSFKGVDITLLAINKLQKEFRELRVISFGSQVPLGNEGFDKEFEFYHSPAQEKIRELYSQCDIWMTASKVEGFNLPAMEAMACRTPVVSTKAGWPEEAISNGVNGVLVEVDDVDGLAKGAAAILSLPEDKWLEMSENAFATTADSSWEKSARLFEKALKNACIRSGRGEISGCCVSYS